jgi:hypothetical protein
VIGLQLFPYDVADEGAKQVVELSRLAATTTLLPAVTYIRESQPVPGGELPRNPVRRRHETDGGIYFRATESRYPPGLVPQPSAEAVDADAALEDLRLRAIEAGIDFVPWVSLLNGRVAEAAPQACVVNARGEPVPGWLCPTREETRTFVGALVGDIMDRFHPRALFADRFRFPEWGERGAIDACTCFCDDCAWRARGEGFDLEAARSTVLSLVDLLERDPTAAARRVADACSSGLRVLRSLAPRRVLLDWLRFRHASVERIAAAAREEVGRRGGELWLDVWPPSYGWLLGQDLARLAPYGTWTKPFTYHRLAGGADIAGFLGSLGRDERERERLYEAFLAFFGFPGPPRFGEFRERGLEVGFIRQETSLARRLLGGRSRLAAGLQLWQVGPEGVRAAVEQAALAQPDGFMFFCYGWATADELAAAGDAVRAAGVA